MSKSEAEDLLKNNNQTLPTNETEQATQPQQSNVGNTQTPVRFKTDPDTYMDAWFAEAPTHHFAMSVGHNAGLYRKVAELMEIPCVQLDQ